MHIVSTQALRKLHQRDSTTNLNIRLNSYVFMESVIERAKNENFQNKTLLYDLINVKNELNMVNEI